MTTTVFFDGMSRINFSIGMALGKKKKDFSLLGYDPERYILKEAKNKGAIEKMMNSVPQGLSSADAVILDLPADLLEQHFEILGEHAKPGTVIIDTSAVPVEVGRLADQYLSKDVRLVSMVPALSFSALSDTRLRSEGASVDLFKNSRIAISSPSQTTSDAEDIASRFAFLLGATPVYMDVVEVQVALAKTRLLPRLISVALMQMVNNQSGWEESQQIASDDFYKTTFSVMNIFDLVEPAKEFLVNQELVLRMLDEYLVELKFMRQSLSTGKTESFNDLVREGIEKRAVWHSNREKDSFGVAASDNDLPTTGDAFSQMFLGGLGKPKKKK